MTVDEMYEDIRSQMRGTNVEALEAMANTIQKAGSTILPFPKLGTSLYVDCDHMPSRSVEQIFFLSNANFLTCSIIALTSKNSIAIPYIHIFKK